MAKNYPGHVNMLCQMDMLPSKQRTQLETNTAAIFFFHLTMFSLTSQIWSVKAEVCLKWNVVALWWHQISSHSCIPKMKTDMGLSSHQILLWTSNCFEKNHKLWWLMIKNHESRYQRNSSSGRGDIFSATSALEVSTMMVWTKKFHGRSLRKISWMIFFFGFQPPWNFSNWSTTLVIAHWLMLSKPYSCPAFRLSLSWTSLGWGMFSGAGSLSLSTSRPWLLTNSISLAQLLEAITAGLIPFPCSISGVSPGAIGTVLLAPISVMKSSAKPSSRTWH